MSKKCIFTTSFLNFDYTYIVLFGHVIYEPLTILTNLVFFALTVFCFRQLNDSPQRYAKQMAWFLLTLGIGSCFGALAHGVHFQLGALFFKTIFFLTNAFSLISIYFCFRSAYTYYTDEPNKYVISFVVIWVAILMVSSLIKGEFLLIKIHAGIVLMYSMAAHYLVYRKTRERGSRIIVTGILISFLSIIVHSLKISFGEHFNYKDIAHVIMIITLIFIYKGAALNIDELERKEV